MSNHVIDAIKDEMSNLSSLYWVYIAITCIVKNQGSTKWPLILSTPTICYISLYYMHMINIWFKKRVTYINKCSKFPIRLLQTCSVHLKKICILHKLDSFYMKGRKGSRLSKFTHFLFIYLFFGRKGGGGTTYEESEK